MYPGQHDDAIRREVLATLKANAAATHDTVLGNWRYRRHGNVDDSEAARLATILDQEREALDERRRTGGRASRWRFWRRSGLGNTPQ